MWMYFGSFFVGKRSITNYIDLGLLDLNFTHNVLTEEILPEIGFNYEVRYRFFREGSINVQKRDFTVVAMDQERSKVNNSISESYTGKMHIYPNPVKNKTAIELVSTINCNSSNLRIFNMVGSQIMDRKISSDMRLIELDMSDFTSGVYTVQLEENGRSIDIQKFVILK